jgi:hypothetical protein
VKVFVEGDKVAPVRIAVEQLTFAEYRSPAFCVEQENARQPLSQFFCHLVEIFVDARTGWTFDFEVIAVVKMVLPQGRQDQEVYRPPDRATPVGVAAEKVGLRFARLVIKPVFLLIQVEDQWMILVIARDGAQSELIVNSDHRAQYNPEAIREIKRILKTGR